MRKTKRVLALILVLIFLISILAVAFPVDVEAKRETLVERGVDFAKYRLEPGKYTAVLGLPRWVYDPDINYYVKWILKDDRPTGGGVSIQNGRIGVILFDHYASFYNPQLTEIKVGVERWMVEYRDGSNWNIAVNPSTSLRAVIDIVENETGVYVSQIFPETKEGQLTVIYVMKEGRPLKHEVYFKTNLSIREYRVKQVWTNIEADKIQTGRFDVKVPESYTLTKEQFEGMKTRRLSLKKDNIPLIVEDFNNAWNEFSRVTISKTPSLIVTYIYQNQTAFTIPPSGTLRIDPDTFITQEGIEDGDVKSQASLGDSCSSTVDTKRTGETSLYMQTPNTFAELGCLRSYIVWNTTTIPDGATVSETILGYYISGGPQNMGSHAVAITAMVENGTRPDLMEDQDLWDEIGDGIMYYNNTNVRSIGWKDETLGSTANTAVENSLTDNWFSFGLHIEPEIRDSVSHTVTHNSFEASPNEPRLNVTYSTNASPTIGEFIADTTFYGGQYAWLNATCKDDDGQSDLDKVFLAFTVGAETIKLQVTGAGGGSPVFAESTDPNNRVTLSGSSRVSVNSSSFKYAFKMRFSYNATQDSAVDIVSGTGVQDTSSATGNATDSGTFAYENRVKVSTLSVVPTQVAPSASLTFTLTAQYHGTSTGITNLDSNITGRVELSGSLKGSNATFDGSGQTEIVFNAEDANGEYTYTGYLTPLLHNQQNQTQGVTVSSSGITISGSPEVAAKFTSNGTNYQTEQLLVWKNGTEQLLNFGSNPGWAFISWSSSSIGTVTTASYGYTVPNTNETVTLTVEGESSAVVPQAPRKIDAKHIKFKKIDERVKVKPGEEKCLKLSFTYEGKKKVVFDRLQAKGKFSTWFPPGFCNVQAEKTLTTTTTEHLNVTTVTTTTVTQTQTTTSIEPKINEDYEIWVPIEVPRDIQPGLYDIPVTVEAHDEDGTHIQGSAIIPIEVLYAQAALEFSLWWLLLLFLLALIYAAYKNREKLKFRL